MQLMTPLHYVTKGEFISYYEQMLIKNDEDKLNMLKVKSSDNILDDNTIFYDFECATKQGRGHTPYFNHMIYQCDNETVAEKTFIHYTGQNKLPDDLVATDDVCRDTFEYVMAIAESQCDTYPYCHRDRQQCSEEQVL